MSACGRLEGPLSSAKEQGEWTCIAFSPMSEEVDHPGGHTGQDGRPARARATRRSRSGCLCVCVCVQCVRSVDWGMVCVCVCVCGKQILLGLASRAASIIDSGAKPSFARLRARNEQRRVPRTGREMKGSGL